MLKMTELSDISRRKVRNNNSEVIRFDISSGGGVKLAKKSKKSKS